MALHRLFRILTIFFALLLVSCSLEQEPVDVVDPTAVLEENVTPEPSIVETEAPRGAITLHVWLPPQFDPNPASPAGDLLKARLEAFEAQHPEINIEVRIKSEAGQGGLLNSLIAANAAAPLAVPDLIALSQHDLETAAIKNLALPIDGLSNLLESDDWYEYARQMVRIQESDFGFAFAGDALTLLFRPSVIPDPPDSLEQAMELGEVLAFPAAGAESLVTLNLYLAHGGEIEDPDGRPFLDPEILETTLQHYSTGLQSGLTPFWLTQYETFSQTMDAFDDEQANMGIIWTTEYLTDSREDVAAAALPGPNGQTGTLATGWTWALTSQDPIRLEAAAMLAEYLVDPSFLGAWTAAVGVLPTRPTSLEIWPPSPQRRLVSEVASSARAVPSTNLLAILGPALQKATVDVLKQLADAETAALYAADQLSTP